MRRRPKNRRSRRRPGRAAPALALALALAAGAGCTAGPGSVVVPDAGAEVTAGDGMPLGIPGHGHPVFRDDFSGAGLDTSKWSVGNPDLTVTGGDGRQHEGGHRPQRVRQHQRLAHHGGTAEAERHRHDGGPQPPLGRRALPGPSLAGQPQRQRQAGQDESGGDHDEDPQRVPGGQQRRLPPDFLPRRGTERGWLSRDDPAPAAVEAVRFTGTVARRLRRALRRSLRTLRPC